MLKLCNNVISLRDGYTTEKWLNYLYLKCPWTATDRFVFAEAVESITVARDSIHCYKIGDWDQSSP